MTYDPKNPTAPYDPTRKKERTTMWVPAELVAQIRSRAYHQGVGVSALAQEALEQWLRNESKTSHTGYCNQTRTVVTTTPGEWFPPLTEGQIIRTGRRSK